MCDKKFKRMKRLILVLLQTVFFSVICFAENTVIPGDIDGAAPPPCHTVQITFSHVSCFGGSNGSASVSINGGTGPFIITWSTGATTNSISNLTAGYYDVRVIDVSTGCSAFDIVEIKQASKIITTTTPTHVNCFGQNTGSIDLEFTGGTPPYSYSWSNGSSAQDINSLAAGTYSVVITDGNGCQANDSEIITQPNTALNSSHQAFDISCNGLTDGKIDITAWGGTPPYNYNWSNGSLTEDVNTLSAGSYSVTITDSKSCSSTESAIIQEPTLLYNNALVTDANCYMSQDGRIDINVFGGTPPYTFSWQNSQYQMSYIAKDLIDFVADQYVVTIKDANLCTITDTLTINSPTEILLSFQTVDVSSNGGVDGSIDLTVSGGVPPYQFNWSNGAITEDLSGIPAGIYSVTVTDNNSCFVVDDVQIFEPLLPLGYQVVQKNVTCHGGDDGEIYLYAQGGVAPYTYQWNSTDTVSILTNLVAGNYIFTITDANLNELVDTIEILQPNQIAFSFAHQDVSCHGLADGSVDLTVSGGTAPYSYKWFNSDYVLAAITEDVLYMKADTYMVVVTDTFGCSNSTMLVISQPNPLTLSISTDDVECFGGSTGNIDIDVFGGTPPYTYQWSNGATTQDLLNIVSGSYSVTVSDSNGCFKIETIMIYESDPIELAFDIIDVSCIDNKDGEVIVFAGGGTGSYSYLWSTGDISDHIYDLDQGFYTVTVTDIYGCTASDSAYVDKHMIECISIPSAFTPNGDAYNDTWIIENIHLYPNCSVKIHNRWGKFVFESKGYEVPWDGSYNGNAVPAETYYYIIKLRDDIEVKTGTVTIVR